MFFSQTINKKKIFLKVIKERNYDIISAHVQRFQNCQKYIIRDGGDETSVVAIERLKMREQQTHKAKK